MNTLFRLSPMLAASVGVCAMVGTTTPAAAVEPPHASVVMKSPVVKRHIIRRTAFPAASMVDGRDVRRNDPCAGVWCGRQFVLMIGIGY